MNAAADFEAELSELLEAACESQLTADQAARLEELARSSATARRRYLECMQMQVLLERFDDARADGHLAPVPASPSLSPRAVVAPPLMSHWLHAMNRPLAFSLFFAAAFMFSGLTLLAIFRIAGGSSDEVASSPAAARPIFVAKIIGEESVHWGDSPWPISYGSHLFRGQELRLQAGFAEIQFENGSRVVLEGPARLTIGDGDGATLGVGKLVVYVPEQARGFILDTPTAAIVDLGTEFGVRVDDQGETEVQVFTGAVEAVLRRAPGAAAKTRRIKQGEALAISGATGAAREIPVAPAQFKRALVAKFRVLDLIDLAVGGDGLDQRCERGIDPTSGQRDDEFLPQTRAGGTGYFPVAWNPFVDGVFVPQGETEPAVVSSAGHTFLGFPATMGTAYGGIWARRPLVSDFLAPQSNNYWVYAMGQAAPYSPQGRGLLAMHANAGITFDLQAIRGAHPQWPHLRLRAKAGNATPADSRVELWVLVDGELRAHHQRTRAEQVFDINLPLDTADRFLTLAVTDGGDGVGNDWGVWGDPQLIMEPPRAAATPPEAIP